jgi:hypothetical protein
MTVWREEDLAAAHAGTKRLDRRDLIGGFDHEAYATQRKMADKAKEFYDKVGEQAVQALLDAGKSSQDFCTAAATGPALGSCSGYTSGDITELLKSMVNAKPAINLSRAYLVVPPDMSFSDIKMTTFNAEMNVEPQMWRNNWGLYGIPVIQSPFPFLTKNYEVISGLDGIRYDVEPVLPRLMAEHVELDQPKDLSVWQALIFVVGVATILCLTGGVL